MSLKKDYKSPYASPIIFIISVVIPTLIIIGIILGFALKGAFAQNVKTYIPPQAFDYRDQLHDEIQKMLPELPDYNFLPALIEHESCISLKHSRCWSPSSTYSTSREHSVGFFQIAKAYRPDGTVRMDTLSDLKNRYTSSLKELTWKNIGQRPDLQFRAGLALTHANWNQLLSVSDPNERMVFVDVAHNSGAGWVAKERRACGLAAGCDAQKWFGNVEKHCLRSKTPNKNWGGLSVCDISRRHPKDVFENRMPKYQDQYFNKEYLESKQ